jgi:hypothetical protein
MNSVPLFINALRAKRLNPEDKYRIPLVDLLLQFISSECHETRDKAFGVLSLCEDCCRKAVPADYAVDIVNLSIKITIHHQSQHSSSDGAQTATIARNVFRAMGMLYTHNEDHEIPSVLTFRGGDTTIPIDTLYGGRVVWLSAPDNHVKPHIPFPPVLDPRGIMKLVHFITSTGRFCISTLPSRMPAMASDFGTRKISRFEDGNR